MKRFAFIFLTILLVSIAYVSAASSLTVPSSIDLGEKSRNETATRAFTITNSGNTSLTNIVQVTNIESDFNVTFNATGFNLTVGQSATMLLNLTIPPDSATGNITIGNIHFTSNGTYTSSSFPLYATVKGGLEIADLDVVLLLMNGKTRTNTDVRDSNKLDFGDDHDVGPGSTLQFEFRIENLFLDREDVIIEDVSVLVTIKEIDDEEDIDEESENFDLDPEEDKDAIVSLELPLKVEEGNYDIEVLVQGEDEEGAEHKVEWNLELKLEKENHDMYIKSASLTKDQITCSGVTSLKTRVMNLGRKDEDNIKIEAKNSDIGLDFEKSGIVLVEDPYDDDNEYERTIPIVIEEGVKPGTYPIDFNVYISNKILFATKRVELKVEGCEGEEPEEEETTEEKNETVDVETEPGEEQEPEVSEGEQIPILSQQNITTTKEKEPISTGQIILISMLATIIIIVVIVGAVLIFKAPKQKTL